MARKLLSFGSHGGTRIMTKHPEQDPNPPGKPQPYQREIKPDPEPPSRTEPETASKARDGQPGKGSPCL